MVPGRGFSIGFMFLDAEHGTLTTFALQPYPVHLWRLQGGPFSLLAFVCARLLSAVIYFIST